MTTVIGVTGGIGVGKTTVTSIISKKLSAPVLDADQISRNAMKSKDILTAICTFFSKDIYDDSGNVDRKKIAKLAFSDESKLRKLNEIIHPYVMQEIQNKILEFSDKNDFILLDVPIPTKEFSQICDFIISVSANYETRINRILSRSTLSRDEIEQRIQKQMPQNEYEALANSVIYNNGNLETLENDITIFLTDQKFLI